MSDDNARLALLEKKIDFVMNSIRIAFQSPIQGMPPRTLSLLEHFIEQEHKKMMEQPRVQL